MNRYKYINDLKVNPFKFKICFIPAAFRLIQDSLIRTRSLVSSIVAEIEQIEVFVELSPSCLVVNFLRDLSVPLWHAHSDTEAALGDWLVADHHLDTAVGAGVLESLVPAIATIEANEKAEVAAEGVGWNTVSGLNWDGVDEVAAVTAGKALDGGSSQSNRDVAQFIWQETLGAHLDDVGLWSDVTALVLGRGRGLAVHARHWHGSHLLVGERCDFLIHF